MEVARPAATDIVLEARGLTKHFPVGGGVLTGRKVLHAVDDLDVSLRAGHITALVGESGSGKSTVARLLARIYPLTSGDIIFNGHSVIKDHGRRKNLKYRSEVQMIFQDPFSSLNPVRRIRHHLARPLLIHKVVSRKEVTPRIHSLLSRVGLVPPKYYESVFPHQLSGGQRQRVAIARALAVDPKVMLADEPISMLDVSIRIGILNLMLGLKEQSGLAFLYITHDIASARYVADDILVMYAGHVVEKGLIDDVLGNPQHPYTQLLLSAVPNPHEGLAARRMMTRGEVPAIVNPKPGCRFAPRCPFVMDVCREVTPKLADQSGGKSVRCHLYPGSA